ncbi:10244_t:CDS:2, partial [Acaulospora morrowiae]
LMIGSPQSYYLDDGGPSSIISPTEDGQSLFSVIMDDGSLQKRRISLSSEYSRQNTLAGSEHVPLLEDYDDDSDSDVEITLGNHPRYDKSFYLYFDRIKELTLTPNQKNIIKCALSYFLASLFTFVPFLVDTFGLRELQISHLVGAVVVFFNPAKTLGGMYEAVLFAILGGIYGMLVGYGSMITANFLYNNDMPNLDHISTVIFWCGGSMFIVAFSRAKLNKPTFNSACSLANIIIFVTLTREGAQHGVEVTTRLIQVTKIIIIGICISFLVSVLVWPVSASKKLRKEIADTLGSFRLLLVLLTKTFLIDDIRYTDKSVQSAIASHRATFTSLQDSLKQAALEIHNGNMQSQLRLYREVINSLTRLAQHLGGLRSCCGLQWEIIKEEENKELNKNAAEPSRRLSTDDAYEELRNYRVLIEFINHIGPPMKALAYTCKRTLLNLQNQFTQQNTYHGTATSFTLLHQNLQAALKLFGESQSRALNKLYKEKSIDGRPNEEIFLIYFFVFSLQEFTKELTDLVDLVAMISKIDETEQARKEKRKWWQFWLFFSCFTRGNGIKINKDYFEKLKHKFPEHTHNLFDTIHTPKPKTFWQNITMNIWKSLS